MLASTSAANPCLVKIIGRLEYVRVIATDIVQAKVRTVVRLLNHNEKKTHAVLDRTPRRRGYSFRVSECSGEERIC